MPGGDKTGPSGMGSMTGRRMGNCVGSNSQDSMNQGLNFNGFFRKGAGRNGGRGKGFTNRDHYFTNIPATSEKSYIENEINVLKEKLSVLETKLSEIFKASKKNG